MVRRPRDDIGRVVGIHLEDNGLRGEVPPELSQLPHLEVINFADNELEGHLPAQLASLGHLRRIWLVRNQLTGRMPEQLGQIETLEVLDVRYNAIIGVVPESLESVDRLMTSGNPRLRVPRRLWTNTRTFINPGHWVRVAPNDTVCGIEFHGKRGDMVRIDVRSRKVFFTWADLRLRLLSPTGEVSPEGRHEIQLYATRPDARHSVPAPTTTVRYVLNEDGTHQVRLREMRNRSVCGALRGYSIRVQRKQSS